MKTFQIKHNNITEALGAIKMAKPFAIRDGHGTGTNMNEHCVGVWIHSDGKRISPAFDYPIHCLNRCEWSEHNKDYYLSSWSNGGNIINGEYQGNGMNDLDRLIICDNYDELVTVADSFADYLWELDNPNQVPSLRKLSELDQAS